MVNADGVIFDEFLSVFNVSRVKDGTLSLIRVRNPSRCCIDCNTNNIRRTPRQSRHAVKELRATLFLLLRILLVRILLVGRKLEPHA